MGQRTFDLRRLDGRGYRVSAVRRDLGGCGWYEAAVRWVGWGTGRVVDRAPSRVGCLASGGDLGGWRGLSLRGSRRAGRARRRRREVREAGVGIGGPATGAGPGGVEAASWRPRLRAWWPRSSTRAVVTGQIAGWLKTTYADDAEMQVSHETIYRTLFIQSRGALRKELTAHLRTGRVIRRRRTRLPGWSGWPARDPQHLRTPARRRPGGAGALGRRPGLRQTHVPGRDVGGASTGS